MAALGKALKQYGPLFAVRGFATRIAADRGPAFLSADGRSVVYDRIRGGDLRLFLCIGDPPFLDAESTWWPTGHAETLESAVAASWEFMETAGFRFLESPTSLSVTEWRIQ